MSDDIKPPDFVDINIEDTPYQHNITPGRDSEFLRALCDALDVGVSILDEKLNYQFISKSTYRDLHLAPGELSVGDSLSKCHDLMIKKGLLTPESLEKNKLSAEDQLANINDHAENTPSIKISSLILMITPKTHLPLSNSVMALLTSSFEKRFQMATPFQCQMTSVNLLRKTEY